MHVTAFFLCSRHPVIKLLNVLSGGIIHHPEPGCRSLMRLSVQKYKLGRDIKWERLVEGAPPKRKETGSWAGENLLPCVPTGIAPNPHGIEISP